MTYEKFKSFGGRYPNKLSSHRLGKLSEIGTDAWAHWMGLQVDSAYSDLGRLREADLIIGSYRIEIKSWADWTWEGMGRCIRPAQMASIRAKADAVLWTVVSETTVGVEVKIEGWSTPEEVAAEPITVTGPPHLRLENHQVSINQMRPLDLLLELLE